MTELIPTFVLNALWQVPAAVAAGLLGDLLLRRAPARHRHVLWVAVLAAAVALPAASLWKPDLPQNAAASSPAVAAGDWEVRMKRILAHGPRLGTWSGDWPADEEGGKPMRAFDVEVHPDGRITTIWYRYQDGANPQKADHPVTRYTVEGNTLKIDTRVEGFTFAAKPAGTAEIRATLEIEGRGKAVYRSLSNSYFEALKKRGESVPPPPPPIPMKRQP